MSEETAQQIADDFLRAWTQRDPEFAIRHCDPEVEFLLPRNLLEGGSYRGHDGVRRAFADAFDSWESFDGQIDAVREVSDRIVLLCRSVQVARHGGPRVDYEMAWVCTMRGGRVVHARPYLDQREALKASGLSE